MSTKNTTRAALVAAFGGACQRCGYARCARALHFHHTDNTEKSEWSNGKGRASNAEIAAHPDRFLLLCANCHVEEHDRLDTANATMTTCFHCGATFRSAPHREVNGRGRYCSRACEIAARRTHALNPDTINARLMKYTEKGVDHWMWSGGMSNGVPIVNSTLANGTYRTRPVRRLLYELEHGTLPQTTQVLRTCDIANCVNPAHSRLGGRDVLMQEVARRGRTTQGERSSSAKLTEDQVREIRARYAAGGISQSKLGKEYGLAQATVGELLRRVTWHHLN